MLIVCKKINWKEFSIINNKIRIDVFEMGTSEELLEKFAQAIAEETVPARQIRDVFLKALNRGPDYFLYSIRKQVIRGIISPRIARILQEAVNKYRGKVEEFRSILIRASELADYMYVEPLVENAKLRDEIKRFGINIDCSKLSVERGRGVVSVKIYISEETFKNIQPRIGEASAYIKGELLKDFTSKYKPVKAPNLSVRFERM